jgi:hypothetical protein
MSGDVIETWTIPSSPYAITCTITRTDQGTHHTHHLMIESSYSDKGSTATHRVRLPYYHLTADDLSAQARNLCRHVKAHGTHGQPYMHLQIRSERSVRRNAFGSSGWDHLPAAYGAARESLDSIDRDVRDRAVAFVAQMICDNIYPIMSHTAIENERDELIDIRIRELNATIGRDIRQRGLLQTRRDDIPDQLAGERDRIYEMATYGVDSDRVGTIPTVMTDR